MYRVIAVVCAAVAGLGLLLFEVSLITDFDEPNVDILGSPEVRQWLRDNESESALASNRFGFSSEAIRFVDELYRAGAVRVVVPEEAIEDDGVEVYADSLVVVLPVCGSCWHSVRLRNHVSWRRANCRVRVFTSSMVSVKSRTPRRYSTTSR